MKFKKKIIGIVGMMIILTSVGFVISQFSGSGSMSSSFYGNSNSEFGGSSNSRVYGASLNPQFSNPNFYSTGSYTNPEVYWPKFKAEDCFARQDIIMQIAPGGCSPAVVRSDLLEEQNVPVFCKVMAIQINPLIDISRIRSLKFNGDYPEGVSGISYFPARAALKSQRSLASSPVQDNLGYLVVVLSQQEIEGDMPESIAGEITATIDYDVEGAFGVGNTNFYVNEVSDEEWSRDYKQYGFWNGKGYIRADSIYGDEAKISIYRDADSKQTTVNLKKGETSKDVYLSGFYCAAGLNIKLDDVGAPVDSALLQINDQQVWVAKGDKIMNSKCKVANLETYGGGGKVSISCPVQNGKFDLTLNPGKAKISNEKDIVKEYVIGDTIDIANVKNVYLGYVGLDRGVKYAVIIKDDLSLTGYEFADKDVFEAVEEVVRKDMNKGNLSEQIRTAILRQYKSKIRGVSKINNSKLQVEILVEGEPSGFGIYLDEAIVAKNREWNFENEGEELAKEYYDQAISHYEDLVDFYSNEKMPIIEEDSYAAMGLYEAAKLARSFEMNEKAQEFYNRLEREYPESNVVNVAIREKELLMKYDSKDAKAIVYVNNEQYFVEVLEFKKPTRDEASVVLLIDGKEEVLGLRDIKTVQAGDKKIQSIQVEKIDNEYVTLRYGSFNYDDYYKNFYGDNDSGNKTSSGGYRYKVMKLKEGDQTLFDNLPVRLVNIHLEEQAKLTISPKMFGPRTMSNFSFAIGIEKRGIKLSPDQTKEMIENLEETIKEWGDANEKLGKVVKGMKAACFATSAMLTVKNLFDGASGKSMARKKLMTNQEGWNDYCKKLVEEGTKSTYTGESYNSLQNCLLGHNKNIEEEINIYSDKLQETNKILEDIQKQVGVEKTDVLDLEGQVDIRKVEDQFKQKFDDFCKNSQGSVTIPEQATQQGEEINLGAGGICDWNEEMTHEQRREIMTLFKIKQEAGNTVLGRMVDKELGKVVMESKNFYENNNARKDAEKSVKEHNLGLKEFYPMGNKISYGPVKRITSGDNTHEVYGKFESGESVIRVTIPLGKKYNKSIGGKVVIVGLIEDESHQDYRLGGKIYLVDGIEITGDAKDSVLKYLSSINLNRIRPLNQKAYQNKMVNPENLKVEFFERAPYKGLPSLVPFDIYNGWYVKLTYVLSGFGKPYDESGRAINYWICNVGENGMIDFKRSADDICIYYNGHLNEYEKYGMTKQEFGKLVSNAEQAVVEAGRQYGKSTVIINGRNFKTGIALNGEEGRCSDFMSPEDCHIMFNVCDPVICPATRCDLGGKFRVDNVIQTGIIGSLMLCLPNAKEGIMVPICLTGVHAGIDGYLSILKSTVDCLNESLETGRNIGICDEIKSIYLCEFFWKQATPLMNVIIPRIFESFHSQGVRGGGEYLTVQNAWENTKSAIDYFKDSYAINSMQAFNARSTGEIGSEICKSFVSVSYPNSENFLDTLTEPDSPVQYHAWFDENVLTTATLPATSHYKVYFHIYAGKDQGTYYVVYLKDIPKSSYIYSADHYVVDRGYIARGGQVDEARDFTAPGGYKQLCISVNGQDECGFGKVSTSYVINRLSDEYAQEQVEETGIRNSKQCVAGSPSLYSLAQPNLQAGVEDVLDSQLYNQGIIRVCSTENPGKQVTPTGEFDRTNSAYDRWKEVGYCDDPTIKCWLDTSSVKDVIKDLNIEGEALENVDLSILGEDYKYLTEEESRISADWVENAVSGLIFEKEETKESIEAKIIDIVSRLQELTDMGTNNMHRARGHLLLGRLYKKIAEGIKPKFIRGGILDPSDLARIQLEDEESENTEYSFPEVDCNINSARLVDKNIDAGDFFQLSIEFSGACEDWDNINIKTIKGDDGLEKGSYSVVLDEQDKKRKQITAPSNEDSGFSRISSPGTYNFVIGIGYDKEGHEKTLDVIEDSDNQDLILKVIGETEEIEEPDDSDDSNPSEVMIADIKSQDDVYYMSVYDLDTDEESYFTFKEFDYDSQEIVLTDGTRKGVMKDDQGRILVS